VHFAAGRPAAAKHGDRMKTVTCSM